MQRILTFHGVGTPPRPLDAGEDDVWLPESWLEAIVAALPGDGSTLVTFDDGNRSDVDVALPILQRHDAHATFFVLAGRLDDAHHLGRDDVAALVAAGMRVGSHGCDHRGWRGLDAATLEREVGASRTALRECGLDVDEAACPFGEYDRRALRAARAAGYARVYTSDGGDARGDEWLTPRTTITRRRRLDDWLTWVASPLSRPGPLATAKRTVKRWR